MNLLTKSTVTIKGRTMLLILFFITVLVLLTSYTFYQNIQMRKAYFERNLYSNLFVNTFAASFNLMTYQVTVYENLYKDTPDKISIPSDGGYVFFDPKGFVPYLDTLRCREDFQVIIDDATALDAELISLLKEIKKQALSAKAQGIDNRADSLLNKQILLRQTEATGKFWRLFWGKVFTQIGDKQVALSRKVESIMMNTIIGVVLFFVIGIGAIIWYTRVYLRNIMKIIEKPNRVINKLANGELPESIEVDQSELGVILTATNKLKDSLKKASEFALAVGKGQFNYEFKVLSDKDVLGNALIEMKNNLQQYQEKEKEQAWINTGLAQFADLLRNATNVSMQEMNNTFLRNLVGYMQANQGSLFIYNPDLSVLELQACYAYNRTKFLTKQIAKGEGLVGQCFYEKDVIYLTEIPDNYIQIRSGLGDANPNCIVLVPIMHNDTINGVIELASFSKFDSFKIDFLRKIAENLSSVIDNVSRSELSKRMFVETQQKNEELRAQEEEMRQNVEELQATQEEMHRKEAAYLKEIADLKAHISELGV